LSRSLFPDETEIEQLLVGPDSVTWRSASDIRLYAVMLYPLLLQVAHPTVGAGVRDFSDFERRPWDRLLRTIDYVSLLVYGGPEAAPAGRRLRALHKGFQGTKPDGERYYALEPKAYAWVHATLLETYVQGHAHFGRPMTRPEVDAFYREYRGLGRLIGVRERDLPEDWDSFRHYFDHMVRHELERTESVERVLRSVARAARPPLPIPNPVWRAARLPAGKTLWLGGVGLMSPELREHLGIGWSRRDEAAFRVMTTVSRALEPALPRRLKVTGPAQLRWRREAIAQGPLGPRGSQATTVSAEAA
jgi:uncharacterized protein (DUF2236 family)